VKGGGGGGDRGKEEEEEEEEGNSFCAVSSAAELHRDKRTKQKQKRTDGRTDGRTGGRAAVSHAARHAGMRGSGRKLERTSDAMAVRAESRNSSRDVRSLPVCISSRLQATRGVYATVRMYVCTNSLFLSAGYRFKARRVADLI